MYRFLWGSRMVSELGKRMLIIVAKRGYTGASREVFFHHIRGIKYAMLEKAVLALEKEGLINIEWVGPSNFTVNITSKGVEVAKGYQEDVWKKSAEALEKVQSTKHAEKSLVHDEVHHKKIIDDKMHVSEVGTVADEIIKQMDNQILEEREHAEEGVDQDQAPAAVVVPAWESTVAPGEIGVEKDHVERRISGEIPTGVAEGGTAIPLETATDLGEERIESEEPSSERMVREKRISGDMDSEGDAAEERKAPPRPPRSFIGSTQEDEAPRKVYTEEEAEAEAMAEMEAPPEERGYDEEEYEEPQETPVTDEMPEQELDTPPGFSLEELLADDQAQPSEEAGIEEAGIEDAAYTPSDTICMWEPENECPILKAIEGGWEGELTSEQCIICQLIQVKQILQNR